MRAIVFTHYGAPGTLQLKEVPAPVPKDNQVLIKIHATTVTAGDCEIRSFRISPLFWLPVRLYMGLLKPRVKVLGQEFAGEVITVGKDVEHIKKGDLVFSSTDMNFGAYAEYICLPGKHPIGRKPANASFEEAATIPVGGLNALHFLQKANIQAGEKILIKGAGGSIGTVAVQIAKSLGAEVTAVDSTKKLDMLRRIGADHVIDYTREDFTRNGEKYDVIFDIAGKSSFARSVRSLRPGGRYLLANVSLSGLIRGLFVSMTGNKKVISGLAPYTMENLETLRALIEKGVIKPVIDKRYPLEEIKQAHIYVEEGHKTGNVVITVAASYKP